jgi:hypothetical protein
MTCVASSYLPLFLLACVLVAPLELVAQNLPKTQTAPTTQSSAASLQQLLDRDDYIAYSEAMAHVNAASLTESQRSNTFLACWPSILASWTTPRRS